MYGHNETGPWPIVDLEASRVERTTTIQETAYGSPLRVCLDTQNLGTQTEAFINAGYISGMTSGNRASFGVCLAPTNTFMDNYDTPLFVDISMSALLQSNCSQPIAPFIGYIDTAAVAIGDGFDANNLVTNFSLLPVKDSSADHLSFSTHCLLKDIVSGDVSEDKFLCIGFIIQTTSTDTITYLDYTISARYAYTPVSTFKRY
jgi:hypothetical protein